MAIHDAGMFTVKGINRLKILQGCRLQSDTTQKLITQKMLSFPSSDTTNRPSSFM